MIILLLLAAAFIAYAEIRLGLDKKWVWLAKIILALTAPIYLGGLFSPLAAFLAFQAIYIPVKNYLSGKDIWFIDNETWIGEFITKYLGDNGGRTLFFVEIALAILLLI